MRSLQSLSLPMATLSAFYYCPAEVGEKKKNTTQKENNMRSLQSLSLPPPIGPNTTKKEKKCAASNLSLYHPLLGPTPLPILNPNL